MFCKNCGNEINEKAVVCIHCGCAVEQEVENKQINTEERKLSILSIIGFCVAVVFAFVPGWFGLFGEVGAFVVSIIGVNQAKKNNLKLKGLGIAGIAISAVCFVLIIIGLIYTLILLETLSGAYAAIG